MRLMPSRSAIRTIVLAAVLPALLGGCIALYRSQSMTVQDKTDWQLGKGPLLSDVIPIAPESIIDVVNRGNADAMRRRKFETAQEFDARVQNARRPVLIVTPLPVEITCRTTYDHAAQVYSILSCLPFEDTRPVTSSTVTGTAVQAMEAGMQRQLRFNTYHLLATAMWQQNMVATREEARKLNDDLMAGIVVDRYQIREPICLSCGMRALNTLAPSKPPPPGRKHAPKPQVAYDGYTYHVATTSFKDLVIYRKSDNRVIYHARYVMAD